MNMPKKGRNNMNPPKKFKYFVDVTNSQIWKNLVNGRERRVAFLIEPHVLPWLLKLGVSKTRFVQVNIPGVFKEYGGSKVVFEIKIWQPRSALGFIRPFGVAIKFKIAPLDGIGALDKEVEKIVEEFQIPDLKFRSGVY